jgi:hypothetical protein
LLHDHGETLRQTADRPIFAALQVNIGPITEDKVGRFDAMEPMSNN